MPIELPAPVLALVAAGRRALGSRPFGEQPMTAASSETLTDYALRHGMLAWAPRPLRDEAVRAHMARSLQGVRQLLDIVESFERHAITVVTLKGPILSQWLYGDPAARRFSDLDLLVARESREAARRLLEQIGFERRIPAEAGDVVYASIGAWPMMQAGQLEVDLHWTLAGRRFSRALDAADVFRESIDVSIAGRIVRAPCPDHSAIIILTHSAKHLWYALELPFSIAALVRRTDVDWERVRDLAARAGALRGAAAGLALAADLFAVDVPAPFRSDITLSDVHELRRCALTTLALPPGTFADRRLERRMQRLSFDRQIDRFIYDVRRLTEPTRAEWEWVSLPPPLAPLYWPARLVRLAIAGMNSAAARNAR